MRVIISVIKYLISAAVVGILIYTRGLYLELKSTKEKLQNAQETIKELKEELQEAYYHIEMYNVADNTKGEI